MNSIDLIIPSAFITGLLGSLHCIGMCGGIVSALTFGLSEDIRNRPLRLLPYLLAYNGGRIASYALAGALVGFLAGQITTPLGFAWVGRTIAALFMIALGLYLAGWWRGLAKLERFGGHLWSHIEPLGRRFFPVKHTLHALGIGLVWGWLPCGLVYTMLAAAMMTGSAAQGALVMIAFGVGTLPMLLLMGGAARWLANLTRMPWVRQTAAIIIIAFGVYGLAVPWLPSSQHGHSHHTPANAVAPHTDKTS